MIDKLRTILIALAVVLVPFSARAALVSDFADFSLRNSGGSLLLPGRLYVPPEATSDPTTQRPFILFLHGGGEVGTNNVAQVNGNIDGLLAEAKRRGAYLYAPQSPGAWSDLTLTGRVMSMIDRALVEQRVDANRLYVTGLSNGGGGTWNILSRYGARFAAGVPICGVTPASDFAPAKLVHQAIAAFHARNDSVVSVLTSRATMNRILTAAPLPLPTYPSLAAPDFVYESPELDLHYIEFQTGGHGIWGTVYNAPPLYEWMFDHTLAVPEPGGLLVAGPMMFALAAVRCRRSLRTPDRCS